MAAREPSTAAATFLNAFTKFWPVLRLLTPAMPVATFVVESRATAAFASSAASCASILQPEFWNICRSGTSAGCSCNRQRDVTIRSGLHSSEGMLGIC